MADHDGIPRLTNRQREVLLLAAYGLTSTESARVLALSVSTINATRQELKTILETETLTQAVARAMWLGVVSYDTSDDPVARLMEARAQRRAFRGRFGTETPDATDELVDDELGVD